MLDLLQYTPKDWIEDHQYENGNYWNECSVCRSMFIGYRSRVLCKLCANIEVYNGR
jgi:hypothetical protein